MTSETVRVTVQLTLEDKQRFERAAMQQRLSLSAYMRLATLEKVDGVATKPATKTQSKPVKAQASWSDFEPEKFEDYIEWMGRGMVEGGEHLVWYWTTRIRRFVTLSMFTEAVAEWRRRNPDRVEGSLTAQERAHFTPETEE